MNVSVGNDLIDVHVLKSILGEDSPILPVNH